MFGNVQKKPFRVSVSTPIPPFQCWKMAKCKLVLDGSVKSTLHRSGGGWGGGGRGGVGDRISKISYQSSRVATSEMGFIAHCKNVGALERLS